MKELHQRAEFCHAELVHYGRTPACLDCIDARARRGGRRWRWRWRGRHKHCSSSSSSSKGIKCILSDTGVSGFPGGLGGPRVNLGLLSCLEAALFLEGVTAGGAIAGGAVGLLGAMAGCVWFNFLQLESGGE